MQPRRAQVQRLAAAMALAAVATGCRAVEKLPAKRHCDQGELATLAAKLDAASPDARVMLVSEGLPDSCEGLYTNVRDLLSSIAKPRSEQAMLSVETDPRYRPTVERICPAHAEIQATLEANSWGEAGRAIYDLCGFSRYDLLDPEQADALASNALFVWANHEFLLESGTPPAVANSISLAMFRVQDVLFDAHMMLMPPDDLRLVELDAQAPLRAGPLIYVSHRELLFNEEQLASLSEGRLDANAVRGHVVGPLFEKLEDETKKLAVARWARGDDEFGRVVTIVAGAGVTFGALVDTMYTCGRLEYDEFDLVVQPIYPIRRAIRVVPPAFALADVPEEEPPLGSDEGLEPKPPSELRVLVLADGYRVVTGSSEATRLAKLDPDGRGPEAWDREGLAKLVAKSVAANPKLDAVALSAENDITVDVILATASAVLGPDCRQHEDAAECAVATLILEAGAG